jgi:putative transcriptional regulator
MARKDPEEQQPKWLEGHFLISEADMADPNFTRTVVLIINHNADGAFGLVLNRKLTVTLGEAVPDLADGPVADVPLYYGGPVQPQFLFCLHSGLPEDVRSSHASTPVENVLFEPLVSSLTTYMVDTWGSLDGPDRPPIRLYAGYSGWAPGQLESELERNSWVVRPASAKHIFHANPDEGWKEALGELGGMHKIVAETGFKPSLN